jgi:ribosome recycling factor
VNQGDWVMVKIPPMTEERRKEIVKFMKKDLEEGKIRLRNIRHNYLKNIKKSFDEKEITEDDRKKFEKELDDIIKQYNKKLENIAKMKEEDIMKI